MFNENEMNHVLDVVIDKLADHQIEVRIFFFFFFLFFFFFFFDSLFFLVVNIKFTFRLEN